MGLDLGDLRILNRLVCAEFVRQRELAADDRLTREAQLVAHREAKRMLDLDNKLIDTTSRRFGKFMQG